MHLISTANLMNFSIRVLQPKILSCGYKSALALQNLYPDSSLKLTTPSKPHTSASDKFSGYIPVDQLDISYARSSGPGGQNVNKVNTKVDLRFHIETANWLHDDIKTKLLEKYKHKMTKDGFLVFKSDITRSQQLNLADCLNKVRECVLSATYEPLPLSDETVEKIRKRREAAVRERLTEKRMRSQTKTDRRAPDVRGM